MICGIETCKRIGFREIIVVCIVLEQVLSIDKLISFKISFLEKS